MTVSTASVQACGLFPKIAVMAPWRSLQLGKPGTTVWPCSMLNDEFVHDGEVVLLLIHMCCRCHVQPYDEILTWDSDLHKLCLLLRAGRWNKQHAGPCDPVGPQLTSLIHSKILSISARCSEERSGVEVVASGAVPSYTQWKKASGT